MALFHLSVTQTKRSAGQSAIASAAYRAGERLYSEYYGEYSDYTRKGGVICSDILLPLLEDGSNLGDEPFMDGDADDCQRYAGDKPCRLAEEMI